MILETGPVGTLGAYTASEREIVTKIFSGLKMYLDPRDISVVPHVILDGIWEDAITKAWLSVQRPATTVFDIGANFGYYGILAAQLVEPNDARIILFEANPNLLPYIRKTLSVNWLNRHTIVEGVGISDKAGTAELTILRDYIGSSSLHSVEHLNRYVRNSMMVVAEDTVTVNTVSIDGYCQQHGIESIDLIKMDIEGYEEKAYAGMKGMIEKSPRMILFLEFTRPAYEDPEGFYNEMLSDFGHVYIINETNGDLVEPVDPSYRVVASAANNWVMLVFTKEQLR